jgi:hypothetical protein
VESCALTGEPSRTSLKQQQQLLSTTIRNSSRS